MHTHSSEYHVCSILIEQAESGSIKVVRPRGAGQGEVPHVDATNVDALLARAETLLADGDFTLALRHLRAAKSLEPDNRTVQEAIDSTEQSVRSELKMAGIELTAVPRVSEDIEDFSALDISPDQGFILSRINGSMDIQTILKISPMPQLDALLTFWRLSQAGHIQLAEPS